MNSRLFATILVGFGAKLVERSNSAVVLQGTDAEKKQAIAGILTAGLGVYSLGRADGYEIGKGDGAREAVIFLNALGKMAKK